MPTLPLVDDCHDAGVLLPFWAEMLGDVPSPPPGFEVRNARYQSPGVPDEELDLTGDGRLRRGATELRIDDDPEHGRYAVGPADPEGDELCLVRPGSPWG